jgi:hypothetical protein
MQSVDNRAAPAKIGYTAQHSAASQPSCVRGWKRSRRSLQAGRFKPEPGKGRLLQTRRQVVAGWAGVSNALREQGEVQLAAQVDALVRLMPRVMTDRERIAVGLLGQVEA